MAKIKITETKDIEIEQNDLVSVQIMLCFKYLPLDFNINYGRIYSAGAKRY